MNRLSIIIPVYYSAETLEDCYSDLTLKVIPYLPDYEIIMVDDGSGDNSYELMQKIAALDDKVQLLKLSKNFGSHAAVYAGLSHCTGDCAVLKAADCQEPANLILDMFAKWLEGNKVILATRENRRDGSLFTDMYYSLVKKIVSNSMPEGGFDCYLIDRNVIETLKLLDEKDSALTLQILWTGFSTATVPYERLDRQKGKSRWTLKKKISLVVDSFIGFSTLPLKMLTAVGVLFFFGAVIWGIALIVTRIFNLIPVQGWTTLAVIVLMSSGMIMLTMGILAEYIWRILDASRGRPVYIIDEQKEKINV